MKPLQEWVCDTCGKLIAGPEEGWLEWLRNKEGLAGDFRICHSAAYLLLQQEVNSGPFCQQYKDSAYVSDLPLASCVGPEGLVHMLSLIHHGNYHQLDDKPGVRDYRGWAEMCRRLFIPYYEEARLYWGQALTDGYFSGANEVWMYLPDTLERLISAYGPRG